MFILLAAIFSQQISTAEPKVASLVSTQNTKEETLLQKQKIDPEPATSDQNENAFVLSAVRQNLEGLEPHPVTKIIEMSIDPEYSGEKDSYLVNVVLKTQEQKFQVGVMVTAHKKANGWDVSLAYLD
jgi:hypothetical protein